MKSMKKLFIFFTASLILPAVLTAGAFDEIGINAKPVSMGNAFVASGSDINSVSYNPAGLSKLHILHLVVSYRDFYDLDLLTQKYAAIAIPSAGLNSGISWNRLSTTNNVKFLDYSEDTITLTFASRFPGYRRLLLGSNINFYKVVSEYNATGYGIDLGMQMSNFIHRRITIGTAIKNINEPSIYWDTGAKDTLKRIIRAGIAFSPVRSLVFEADYGTAGFLNIGAEFIPFDSSFTIRAGGRNLLDSIFTLSSGIGLEYRNLLFDYAVTSHTELGITHFFTIMIKIERI